MPMATQSLYRRYRPRRFGELKGQEHVVRALRDAVAQGRAGQAYLFSGPRGTGKTTSARILAKVLNCENVIDGEPCCECESCLAVERGTSYDVHELDAASNRGIDAMRNLIEKASLGTAGRHKVYILDEVHMLTKEAEAALLKTLEEPPPHVVFVLATTDPQKMSDTIRSRTQHLQFHLLPTDTLADHVRWVADDAGLELSQAALDAAIVQGGGSARDTLSALELLANTGGDVSDLVDLDEFLTALVERDAGRALTAMGHAVSLGRDPRAITEEIVRHLRNAFLSLMAPELVMLPHERVDAIAAKAQQLGAAMLVRAIERLGSTLVDMRHAPDPRILVEVALVQLTHDEAGTDVEALLARIERLEHTVKQLREGGAVAGGAAAVAAAAAPRDPSTGRAVLGGAARRDATGATPRPTPSAAAPAAAPAADPESATDQPAGATEPTPAPAPVADPAPAAASTAASTAASASVPEVWEHTVKAQVKPLVRALYSAGSFVGHTGDVWHFGVPNEAHATKCAAHQSVVEQALSAAVGAPVSIRFVVGGGSSDDEPAPAPRPAPSSPAAPPAARTEPAQRPIDKAVAAAAAAPDDEPRVDVPPPPDDDEIDLSELTDAPPETVKTPIDRLAEAFPGSELVHEE
jgi:DNA polymerase-3 subunit gamma/tau